MDAAEIEQIVKNYIKENLQISMYLNAGPENDNQYISISVELLLDGEVISKYHDSVSY